MADKKETEADKPSKVDPGLQPHFDTPSEVSDASPIEENPAIETEVPVEAGNGGDEPIEDEAEPFEDIPSQKQETNDVAGPASANAVAERRSGFGPALIGGVLAAIIGFVAGKSEILNPIMPPAWQTPDLSGVVNDLSAKLTAQSEALSALQKQTENLKVPDVSGLNAQLAELAATVTPLGGQIAEVSSAVGTLEDRLTAVEKRPLAEGVSQSAIDAYERELNRMRESVAAQRSEVEKLVSEARDLDSRAAEAAQKTAIQATVARLHVAIDNGAPFADVTEELTGLGVSIPEPLAKSANSGVATLTVLQTTFAPAARAALAADRENSEGRAKGLGAFLTRQLGTRSVAPRDGDDADAVLSRAESFVINGRLDKALEELAALPDPAKPAMQDWISQAQTRQAALDAADTLSDGATQ